MGQTVTAHADVAEDVVHAEIARCPSAVLSMFEAPIARRHPQRGAKALLA